MREIALTPLRGLAIAAFLVLCGAIAGCTQTEPVKHTAHQKPIPPGSRVLLMKPDIECVAVTMAGLPEPNAAKTAESQRNVEAALSRTLTSHEAELVKYDDSALSPETTTRHLELYRLYEMVGVAMMTRAAIPTAKAKTNWSLGPGVSDIKRDFEADYALFIHLRDHYETGGRTAFRVTAAVFGIVTMSASDRGFAALVDLESGDIVWFNELYMSAGSLTSTSGASETVDALLEGFPVQ